MEKKDEEFLKKILSTFKAEAQDHLRLISSGLIQIERDEPQKRAELIETAYRESHSLKGRRTFGESAGYRGRLPVNGECLFGIEAQ